MNIGYFSSIIGTPGGPAIVDQKVIEAIADIDKSNTYTVYGLTSESIAGLKINNDNIKTKVIFPSGKWLGISIGMPLELKRNPVDLLHGTFVPPLFSPCKLIVTMSCWSQYTQPEVYPALVRKRFIFLTELGIRKASAVFCYTEFLKNNVVERFALDPERVFITSPAVGEEIKPIKDKNHLDHFLKQRGIEWPYILFIGAITRRKNITGLIHAYHILRNEASIDQKLVLLGEKGYFFDEIMKTIHDLKLEKDIFFVDRHPYHELPYFYAGADVFVFPTFSEGFGLPPLEAMACGTPVVASNVSSVPEVVGEGALLADPSRPEDIAEKINCILADETLRNDMIQRGYSRAAEFTWEKSAEQVISAYEKVYEAGW